MIPSRFTLIGATLFAIGMLVLGMALTTVARGGTVAHAGNNCVTPDPTAQTTAVAAFQQACPTATKDRPNKTHTPTDTATPEPRTPEPTSVPPTPVPTKPGGGAGGEEIAPPNTGFGPDSGSDYTLWLILTGVALAVAGGGAVAVGARTKR